MNKPSTATGAPAGRPSASRRVSNGAAVVAARIKPLVGDPDSPPPKAGKPSAPRDYAVAAVDRAIDVLNCFSSDEPELSLARAAQLSGLPKPTVFRLLRTLAHRGLVTQRAQAGVYALGYALIGMSEIAKSRNGVVFAALPAMRQLRDALNETAYLSVRVGDTRIDIEQLESAHSVRRVMSLGDPKELYAGCSSRVLLAAMSDAEIDAYLKRTKLIAFSRHTIADGGRLRAAVIKTRKQGYAEGWDERNSGGAGVAAPIYGSRNDVVAAIAVGAPTHRFDADLRQRSVEAVLAASDAISRQLGQTRAASPASRSRR